MVPLTQTFTVIADGTPPEVTIESPNRGQRLIGGECALDVRFADEGGSGIDPASLRVVLDGRELEGLEPAADRLTGTITLPDGAGHVLSVEVRDRAGNRAFASVIFEMLADREPPELRLDLPAGAVAAGVPTALTGGVRDDGSGLTGGLPVALLDGRPLPVVPGGGGTFAVALPDLAPGLHRLLLVATDAVGNRSTREETITSRRRVDPPAIRIEEPAAEVPAGSAPILVAIISAAEGGEIDPEHLSVRLDGVVVPLPPRAFDPATGRLRLYLPHALSPGGQYVITVDAADREGNESFASKEVLGR
ncbi:MAG: hypothetical protein MUE73_04755 [Planctomycetes bacterium]|nr:hypothetical protein [Planctomycetota bacterium]